MNHGRGLGERGPRGTGRRRPPAQRQPNHLLLVVADFDPEAVGLRLPTKGASRGASPDHILPFLCIKSTSSFKIESVICRVSASRLFLSSSRCFSMLASSESCTSR